MWYAKVMLENSFTT